MKQLCALWKDALMVHRSRTCVIGIILTCDNAMWSHRNGGILLTYWVRAKHLIH